MVITVIPYEYHISLQVLSMNETSLESIYLSLSLSLSILKQKYAATMTQHTHNTQCTQTDGVAAAAVSAGFRFTAWFQCAVTTLLTHVVSKRR